MNDPASGQPRDSRAGWRDAEEVGIIRVSADRGDRDGDGRGGDGRGGGGGGGGGADIIEAGAVASRPPWRRSTTAWALVAAILVGGLAGYLVGVRHAGTPVASPSTSPQAPARQPALVGTGNRCAVQLGKQLQLGVELVNGSDAATTIDRVEVDLPLNGLQQLDSAWGSCGQLTTARAGGHRLDAGAVGWVTVTFDVLVPCPSAIPVGFIFQYEHGGEPGNTEVWGFSDLGEVTYTGCPTGTSG
ncbi:hypothetical protein [Rugosimonospora africana]|uniref:Uncharacterized protein n=1 Tax=Rugosimonospora africana TaxID=556532 RepID=A0A8J3R3R9_9ACTN|nr:hypothetical protein [Rugosimonospora africana]GIH20942.1 hypothetical protein Raf01_91140 [Rugosimonospora africana]